MWLQRLLKVIFILWTITACGRIDEGISQKLVIGVVAYDERDRSLEEYAELQNYLSTKLKSIIEIEPTYNEVQAREQIAKQRWDLVFASPGLAAIAISQHQYQPLLPLEGVEQARSVIVANQDSPFETHQDLNGQSIALGQEGSATSYYLPIYNLYGLTLQKVLFSPTPQTSLKLLETGEVAAAALSLQEFNRYRQNFKPKQFRIINIDSHTIPSGAIVISAKIPPQNSQLIEDALTQAPSHIAASAGFLPNEDASEYEYLIRVMERVLSISENIKDQPALLYEKKQSVAQ